MDHGSTPKESVNQAESLSIDFNRARYWFTRTRCVTSGRVMPSRVCSSATKPRRPTLKVFNPPDLNDQGARSRNQPNSTSTTAPLPVSAVADCAAQKQRFHCDSQGNSRPRQF